MFTRRALVASFGLLLPVAAAQASTHKKLTKSTKIAKSTRHTPHVATSKVVPTEG